jgi:chorismate mutase
MEDLERLRSEVDALDTRIVELLGQRLALVERIATLKADRRFTAVDPDRERDLRALWSRVARDCGVDEPCALAVLEAILEATRARVQARVAEGQPERLP